MSFQDFTQFISNLDEYLDKFVAANGSWTYLLAWAIVFAETGLVIMPFLPGDSLLFALGAIAARHTEGDNPVPLLNLWLIMFVLVTAAVIGNTVNYVVGRRVGMAAVRSGKVRFVKQEHLDRTHAFFEKHGGKSVVISRFVPIIRTIAPFVAGAGQMNFFRFQFYNVLGAVLWVVSCCVGGYFFGNLPFVRENFSVVVMAIVVISLLPVLLSAVKMRRESAKAAPGGKASA